MIKGAVFDVDGTLIDSMGMWNECGGRYLASLGLKEEAGLAGQLALLPIQESGKYLKKHYSIPLSPEEITAGLNKIGYDFYMNEAKLKPYIPELLEALASEGIPMTVATASDSGIVNSVLTKMGIRDYFSEIHDCGELGFDKSHPECFIKCAALLGTPGESTWVFEDMLHAAGSAHRAGLKVGGMFDLSSAKNEEAMRNLCDYYFKSQKDFDEFIRTVIKKDSVSRVR